MDNYVFSWDLFLNVWKVIFFFTLERKFSKLMLEKKKGIVFKKVEVSQ